MSPVTRETPPRARPAAASGPAGKPGPITIRRLPPPPQASGKGTPAPAIDPAQTILGYTAPVAPGPVGPAPEDFLPAGTKVGDYEIVELIGAGGMGSVYRARYPVIDREVAIKVIASQLCRDPGVVQQFVIEARAANQIANRHVVDIHTLGTLPDGRPYLVMELLRGQTLTQRIDQGPLDVAVAIPILEQVAEAMEAAHAVPIVHRDLKPDNVFLVDSSDGPQVKILDFGIARLASEASPAEAGGDRGDLLIGTPFYMAPEQARANLVGTPADLYALGLIAFEMLAGRAPFLAETASEVLAAHEHAIPPALKSLRPEVPEGLDELVERLLAKDPGERPTATEVRAQLRALYQRRSYPRSVPAVGLPLHERARLWAQRFRAQIAIAAAVLAGVLIALVLLSGRGGDHARARSKAAPAPAAASSSVAAPVAPAPAPASPATATAAPPPAAASSADAPSPAGAEPSVTPLEPVGAAARPASPAPAAPAVEPPAASPDPILSPAPAPARPASRDRDAPIADPFAH